MTRKPKIDNGIVVGSQGAENLGLPEPYAASPGRPGKYCLYVTRGERLITHICCTEYAAKKFLDILLENENGAKVNGPTDDDMIMTVSGLSIRGWKLYQLIDYKLSTKEEQWELDERYVKQVMRFKVDREESTGEETPARTRKEKVERTPKPSKEGLITIGQIAEELKMEPRDARAALRAAKVDKPSPGWCWAKNEVDEIKKILHNHK